MTEPIDINGRTDDLEATSAWRCRSGVSVSGTDTVRVMVTIEEDIGTRTFLVGVEPMASDRADAVVLDLGADRSVTLGGPYRALDAVDATVSLPC